VKRRRIAAWLSAFLLLTHAALAQEADLPSLDEFFDSGTLIIETGDLGCFKFDIHIATTYEQQRRGLMFVREMDDFAGMLFIYTRSDVHSMWMKNTYIPLDILFVKADGQVSSIAANTEPLSLTSVSSRERVRYVLELNAGMSARLGIDQDSRLILTQTN